MNSLPRSRALALLAAVAAWPGAAAVAQRPNVVVMLADDLGYGDVGCYGNRAVRTPHLDRLAAEGLRLTACYSAAPVCSPSRAALLTGRVPQRLGILEPIPENSPVHLGREEITLARLLGDAGYATCMVGKWHCAGALDGSQPTPRDHGFEHWMATQNNAAPSHANPVNFMRDGEPIGTAQGYSSLVIVDEAVAWLRGLPPDRPFFLYVAFHEPHDPIASDAEFVALYPDVKERRRALYYANVSQLDAAVGRLMGAIDERQLAANTLVLFTSDNGPVRSGDAARDGGSAGGLRGAKFQLFEGGIRVAGIVRWPAGVAVGATSDAPLGGVDVLPTVCELTGVKPPADRPLDGTSFAALLRGEALARRKPLYWQYDLAQGGRSLALRDGNWKLLSDRKLEKFELYDLAVDPREQTNLSAREPERLGRMVAQLRGFHADVNAR